MEGLRCLLHSTGDWQVVAAESCPADLLDAIGELRPEVAVFDRALGMERVLASIESLRDSGWGAVPIVWGASLSEADAVRLVQAGAVGVVRKTCGLRALVECVYSAGNGGTWIEEGLITTARPTPRRNRPPLTDRELQVSALVERSFRNKDIAAALGIQVGTVKVHLRHIFEKTGTRGRHGLALSGLRAKAPAHPVLM